MPLKLCKSDKNSRDPQLIELEERLLKRQWPKGFNRQLSRVLARSWHEYERWYARIQSTMPFPPYADDPNDRLLRHLMASGFITTPYFFLKWWFLAIIRKQLEWREGNKWMTWKPTHTDFLNAGREVAFAYCGVYDRFDRLMKELP